MTKQGKYGRAGVKTEDCIRTYASRWLLLLRVDQIQILSVYEQDVVFRQQAKSGRSSWVMRVCCRCQCSMVALSGARCQSEFDGATDAVGVVEPAVFACVCVLCVVDGDGELASRGCWGSMGRLHWGGNAFSPGA